jgi:predicted ABC-type ATPase
MPDLYMIAGPNGAGKSTLSTMILPEGLFSFDGDKELQFLQQRFPETSDAQLFSYVNDELFAQRKNKAIKASRDFAFETNFTTANVMDTVRQFKEQGYVTHLIYIGLPSVDEAISRVELRVQQGGHQVSTEQIISNFENGIEQTSTYIRAFDHAILLENAMKVKAQLAVKVAMFQKGKQVSALQKLPGWAERIMRPEKKLLPKNKTKGSKGKRL